MLLALVGVCGLAVAVFVLVVIFMADLTLAMAWDRFVTALKERRAKERRFPWSDRTGT
jgi:uncharacterized membrane protein